MVRTIVQLTDNQSKLLREKAREEGVSISEMVRRCVDTVLTRPSRDAEVRRRAIEAAGMFRSGTGDLAEKHNEYFVEAILDHIR